MLGRILRLFAIVFCVLTLSSLGRAQAQLVGEWSGVVKAGDQNLKLLWHVKPGTDSAVISTFDNVDQQVFGIKTTALKVDGAKVTVTIDDTVPMGGSEMNLKGIVEGTLSKDGNEFTGTWTQTAPEAQPPIDFELKRQAAPAQISVAGDWKGTLSAGGMNLRLVLHLKPGADGALTGTLDSVDQGANGIPVTSAAVTDGKVKLTVDAVHGTYDGTLNADASEMKGTWSQGQPMQLDFKRSTAGEPDAKPAKSDAKPAAPSDIDGVWAGALDVGATKLHLNIKIANTTEGLSAQMQSPDQNPMWTTITIERKGADVTMALKAFTIEIKGKLSADQQSMDCTFTQGGVSRPLALKRSKDVPIVTRNRPQMPVKPYPYREEEVSYANPAGDKLAATLTIPEGKGPFPAVVLVQGSGRHERDEDLLLHKPFLVLSDYLTRHGIAVLRADKRGVGKSGGNFDAATTADFADDAEAAFRFLATRSEVDTKRVGLVGHSEGGTIAPIVAARDKDVAFIVMLAGTGVNGAEIVAEQQKLVALANGEPKEKVEKSNAEEKQVLEIVRTEKNAAEAEKKMRAVAAAGHMPQQQVDAQVKTLLSPWFRYFLTYEPSTSLRQVKCPVLVLNGSLDLQVPPAQNLPPIRKALAEAGNKSAEIDEMPGLNHLFQSAKTGAPSEYIEIEETMSPAVLEKIANWVMKQPKDAESPILAQKK
jgi:hypothetical protein